MLVAGGLIGWWLGDGDYEKYFLANYRGAKVWLQGSDTIWLQQRIQGYASIFLKSIYRMVIEWFIKNIHLIFIPDFRHRAPQTFGNS